MISRYRYATNLTTSNTKIQYLGSVIYPKIKPSDNDIYIISDSSDRLDILALKYYNDQSLWWIIATDNNLNDASYSIESGKQLRIPSNLNKIINDFEKINK